MMTNTVTRVLFFALAVVLSGCSSSSAIKSSANQAKLPVEYIIGPGDTLEIFVWQNPEISVSVPVRPDGKISTPLVEDMQAVGKSPTKLARDMEVALSRFVKTPQVNIIVTDFVGAFSEQIRVVGKAAEPQAITYRRNMTLLDVMIEVGGLAEGAAGNRAKIIRRDGKQHREFAVKIHDLLNKGKIAHNVEMMPGDVLIIPESLL